MSSRPRPNGKDVDPTARDVGADGRSEGVLVLLLLGTAIGALCFVGLFIADPNTQLLGISFGLALAFLAAGLILVGKRIVPQETKVEERPGLSEPEQVSEVTQTLRAGTEGITRRRLIAGAAGVAGAGLVSAAAIPVVGLGPGLTNQLSQTPWYAGRALVDVDGNRIPASAVGTGSFLTAFPEGADMENLGSPIVVVRVDPSILRLPRARADWAPEGILAYSKICTHAGCAISLFRSPLNPSTENLPPALVCPCHYSTFDVLEAAKVEFGPAGRPLPQLPLRIDTNGMLRAGGRMSGPVGPSWWGDAN